MEEYLQLGNAKSEEPCAKSTGDIIPEIFTIKDGVLQLVPTLPIPHSCVADFISTPATSGEVRGYGDIDDAMKAKYGPENSYLGTESLYRLSECIGIIPDDTTKTLYNNDINIDRLRQLRIVDFGCGAAHPKGTPEGGEKFEPWLCRALHLLGVNVTGVDLRYPRCDYSTGEKSAEEWDFKQVDLTSVNAPQKLGIQANSVDVANANALLDDGYNEGTPSPSLFFGFNTECPQFQEIEAKIFGLALRILKPGGVFIISYKLVYQKVGGPLVFNFKEINGQGKSHLENIMHVDPSFLNLNPQK